VGVISMITDFGIKDGNVGVMKGVIWGISPGAQIADLSHMIAPQNLREAAFVLSRSAPHFPSETVHLVVVDPGVGTARRPMAARISNWYYVGPDNGIITQLVQRAEAGKWPCKFVHLENPQYWLPQVSHVFHGRDIFAPVAAHLLNGVSLTDLGTEFSDPVTLDLPRPLREPGGWRGEVIHIDHFGNAATNILSENLGAALLHKEAIIVRLGNTEIEGLVNTFGERNEGQVIALLGSNGNLIVSVVNGNAASVLNIRVGDPLLVQLPDRRAGADEVIRR
jgi:S-adenosylmethionine hydrolase